MIDAIQRWIARRPYSGKIWFQRLHAFASDRCGVIENAIRSEQDPYLTRQNLITNTLRFSESVLKGWILGSHFELCVFVDQREPLLFAYFDSNRNVVARSMG
jgi:hypothetical protein